MPSQIPIWQANLARTFLKWDAPDEESLPACSDPKGVIERIDDIRKQCHLILKTCMQAQGNMANNQQIRTVVSPDDVQQALTPYQNLAWQIMMDAREDKYVTGELFKKAIEVVMTIFVVH